MPEALERVDQELARRYAADYALLCLPSAQAAERSLHALRDEGRDVAVVLAVPWLSADVRVVFADLQGFTAFSETHDAREVATMLNEYFETVIPPLVRDQGGDVDRIIGDALMVTFNRRGDQPDHAERAARAALAIQRATAARARDHPGWPRFRVGVNTGHAAVGVLGSRGGRTHTAIGDTVNVASRLEGAAPVGTVVIGPESARRLPSARTRALGRVTVKGRSEPIEAQVLESLNDE